MTKLSGASHFYGGALIWQQQKQMFKMVTERIIVELEKGIIPWEKPWTGVRDGAFNRITKKTYSLIIRNSAAYIQSWLQVLRNDNKFIVSASSKAEKAVNYIMNQA